MGRRDGLRDDQWEKITDVLPGREGTVGVTAKENRRFVEAVLYRYRAGIPWRDLPERFGAWNNIARRHRRWSTTGVWQSVFAYRAEATDNEYRQDGFHDCPRPSTCRRGKRGDKTTEGIGRSKGGLTTKLHATCDALGKPPGVHLTPGQAHDLAGADALLPAIVADIQSLLADKAYDAQDRVLSVLETAGGTAVIPPKANRKEQREYDKG